MTKESTKRNSATMDQLDPAAALNDMCVYLRIRLKKMSFFSVVPATIVETALTSRSKVMTDPATSAKLPQAVIDTTKTDDPLALGYATVLYFRNNEYDDRRQQGIGSGTLGKSGTSINHQELGICNNLPML